MSELTHVDAKGRLSMVDVGAKEVTQRMARARAILRTTPKTRDKLLAGDLVKGEALAAARVAGIMAAKQCGNLIPLCHPLGLTQVVVRFAADYAGVLIETEAHCEAKTGVEMEAMVAASVAGLTLYDMAKAIEREMSLSEVRLVEKRGGKSGVWLRDDENDFPPGA